MTELSGGRASGLMTVRADHSACRCSLQGITSGHWASPVRCRAGVKLAYAASSDWSASAPGRVLPVPPGVCAPAAQDVMRWRCRELAVRCSSHRWRWWWRRWLWPSTTGRFRSGIGGSPKPLRPLVGRLSRWRVCLSTHLRRPLAMSLLGGCSRTLPFQRRRPVLQVLPRRAPVRHPQAIWDPR